MSIRPRNRSLIPIRGCIDQIRLKELKCGPGFDFVVDVASGEVFSIGPVANPIMRIAITTSHHRKITSDVYCLH